MRFSRILLALAASLAGTDAQQYLGDVIPNSLPTVPGSEITYFRIRDPTGANKNLTLTNYYSHGSNGQRIVESKIERVVVIIHGLNRDPGTYMSNALSALSQVTVDKNVNFNTVAIMAPYFPNGDDKNVGYPWTSGLAPGRGSTTNALVWSGSQWSAGGNNQYPYTSKNTSSYTVLDQVIQYFDNATLFPNLHQIVIAGHSLGGQTVQRYAAIGTPLGTRTPVTYWIANPNSYVWLSTDRPLAIGTCSIYDNYREGYNNFTQYPMTYGTGLVAQGRSAILANFQSKAVMYARGTQDLGDDSSNCAPFSQGANRNERFFNFIQAFPPSCPNPSAYNCDTVDFVNAGHDAGAMMASAAGQARLFLDNFSGNGSRAYDFGYPRQQVGDDPFPNPALNGSIPSTVNNNTYAGNMTYWGCWSDQQPATLTNMTYTSNANTIEMCTATCAQGNNTLAGLEFGTQCYCGSSLGYEATQVIDTSCGTPCPGNSSEICGGGNRLSIYSNGRPKLQPIPGTPEVVDGYYYVACYTEATSGRALAGPSTSGSFMTLEYCGNFCSGYQYFGTEYADECYCGNSFSAGASVTSDADCYMLCANDESELCGAGNRLTVYRNTTWVPGSTPTTTPSSPSSPSTASGPSCPNSNNAVVTSGGKNFTIECGVDHYAGDLTSLSVSSFQQCIDTCAQNSQCVDVSLSGSACYLKSSLGAAVSNSGIWGARLSSVTVGSSSGSSSSSATTSTSSSAVSPTTSSAGLICPGSNSTTYVSANNETFLIECGIDHNAGDMSNLAVSSFQQCIDTCANTPNCVDVSLSGYQCYLKSSVGYPVYNGVSGARLISGGSSSSVVATSASTSASSSSVSATSASTSASSASVSSTSVTSTSANSSPSATPISCPASNSTIYISNGEQFLIECGIDHMAGDMGSLSVSSFQQCIDTCATTKNCVDVALSGSACYLKSSVGAPVYNGVFGARLLVSSTSSSSAPTSTATSPSTSATSQSSTFSTVVMATSTSSGASPSSTVIACPASNSTTYVSKNNETFIIECGIDHFAGDMGSLSVDSFQQCIDTCATTTGCVDVSLSGSACYLKSSVGYPVYNGVLGARLLPSSSSSSTLATSTSI